MKRAITILGLAAVLLPAGLLAAADGAPAAGKEEPAGLCAVATPEVPETPDFVAPVPRVDSCMAYCPDGSPVSCTGPFEYCDLYTTCSPPWAHCAARCFYTISYCPGYGPSNCGC